MLTRKGFVSNSSSSSFLVMGFNVDIENKDLDPKIKNYVAISDELDSGDGLDVFGLTKEHIDLINANKDQLPEYFEVIESVHDDNPAISLTKLEDIVKTMQTRKIDELQIAYGDASHNASFDIEQFKKIYIDRKYIDSAE